MEETAQRKSIKFGLNSEDAFFFFNGLLLNGLPPGGGESGHP